jgi:hypothetical protein
MIRTLLIYDGKMSSAERIAGQLSYLIGSTKVAEITEAPEASDLYEGYCFVFNFYGAVTTGRVSEYLIRNRAQMTGKRISLVGLGFSDGGFMSYIVQMEKECGISGMEGYFVSDDQQVTRVGCEIGSLMKVPQHPMDREPLLDAIDMFLDAHRTMALATSATGYVRCTPLEYQYIEGRFYIITEGGNKFRGIMENGIVSAAIFDPYNEGTPCRGIQLLGQAQLVPYMDEEYTAAFEEKGISRGDIEAMPVTMFVIRITPLRYEFFNTELENDGFDSRQFVTTRFQLDTWQAAASFTEHKTTEEEEAKKRAAEVEAMLAEAENPEMEARLEDETDISSDKTDAQAEGDEDPFGFDFDDDDEEAYDEPDELGDTDEPDRLLDDEAEDFEEDDYERQPPRRNRSVKPEKQKKPFFGLFGRDRAKEKEEQAGGKRRSGLMDALLIEDEDGYGFDDDEPDQEDALQNAVPDLSTDNEEVEEDVLPAHSSDDRADWNDKMTGRKDGKRKSRFNEELVTNHRDEDEDDEDADDFDFDDETDEDDDDF